jgi:uncharacterized protein (DUF1778 family)
MEKEMALAKKKAKVSKAAVKRSKRDESIIFRATNAERALITKAADVEKLDTGVYARKSVLKQAEMDLAERQEFLISDENMNAFLAALDRPVQNKPQLRKLLLEDSVLD